MRKLLTFLAIVTISASCFGIEWKDEIKSGRYTTYINMYKDLTDNQVEAMIKYFAENGWSLHSSPNSVYDIERPMLIVQTWAKGRNQRGMEENFSIIIADKDAVYSPVPLELAKPQDSENAVSMISTMYSLSPASLGVYLVYGSTVGTIMDLSMSLLGVAADWKIAKDSIRTIDLDFTEGLINIVEAAK